MVFSNMFPVGAIGFKYSVTENAIDFKINMVGLNMPANIYEFLGFVTTNFTCIISLLVLW